MYSDLFEALGGGANASSTSNSRNSNNNEEEKPLLSFKAGKIALSLQENNKFLAKPDTRRCQVNLKYNNEGNLLWDWYDRREKKVTDTIRITDPVVLKRADVPKSQDADCNDRVFYFKLDSEWRMLWLQDKEEDPELITNVNKILQKPKKPSNENDSGDTAADRSSSSGQVDALGQILENIGMQQQNGTDNSVPVASASGGGAKKITLADLQSAMGGLQDRANPSLTPGLNEIISPKAINSLMESEEVRNRLLQELPEDQRSEEFLEANLRSPQVQHTLRSLTAALLPDDNGSLDSYQSIIANFQLNAEDGQNALQQGKSPIEAFLDCITASIENENAKKNKHDGESEMQEKENAEKNNYDKNDGDAEMQE